jgi:hypothetical protein
MGKMIKNIFIKKKQNVKAQRMREREREESGTTTEQKPRDVCPIYEPFIHCSSFM